MTDTDSPPRRPRPAGRLALQAALRCGILAIGALLIVLARGNKRNAAAPQAGTSERVIRVEAAPGAAGARLSVVSQPAGASLLLNGRLVGATPVLLDGLPPGSYALRLEKSGCKALCRTIQVGGSGLSLDEKLGALPTGSMVVEVKPAGAEVLLDGELIGTTPLKTDSIPVGAYELLIRKTNYDSYSARIEVVAVEVLTFAGFELKDKVYAMMDGLVKGEPQRLAHYIDLGHYLFVNDRMDEAVDVFCQGLQMMQTPLDFNGPGYSGRDHMSEEEMALEVRLRREDESRFLKELEKHRNWPRKDTRAFRTKLDQAHEILSQKNVASWQWVETAARMNMRNRNYDRAARLYADHIAAAPNSPNLPQTYVALMEVYLMQRDVVNARAQYDKFYALYQNNDAALLRCGSALYPYQDRMGAKGRQQVLEMSEQALRRALTLVKDQTSRAQCLFDLGAVLNFAGRPKEAVPVFEQSIAATADKGVAEERSLRLADALRKAGRIEEAEALYNKLKGSARADIRESAQTGLVYVAADKAKLRPR
ncbi:MAG: tetratricopeptide repeat protein [Planctomycetota bacterium]|nr:tetratricopeptide repeat protein [Planctomycetota bacterium]